MFRDTLFAARQWQPLGVGMPPPLPRHGPVIVGCSGSEASLRAIATAAHVVDVSAGVILVCATRTPVRRPQPPASAHDLLKSEAYLLTDSAAIDEIVRHGRELASSSGARVLATLQSRGNPVHVLLQAADRYLARAILVGMHRDRPSRQAARLARTRPADIDVIASNGTTHLSTLRPAPSRVGASTGAFAPPTASHVAPVVPLPHRQSGTFR